MSVPPERMAVRSSGPTGDPNKIMGLPKWAFYSIIVVGIVLAYYIYRRSQNNSTSALTTADAGAQPDTTNGVTAADIGGTPADNSFATQTDETALEEQIQQLQDSLSQLQETSGGNGAGLPSGGTTTSGGSPGTQGPNPPGSPGGIGGNQPPTQTGTGSFPFGVSNWPTATPQQIAAITASFGQVSVPFGTQTPPVPSVHVNPVAE